MIEFFQWTEKQLIPHIPPRDNVLVIDGAPYHIIQEDTCQTMANNRKHISQQRDIHDTIKETRFSL